MFKKWHVKIASLFLITCSSSQDNIWLLVCNIKRHVKFSYFLLPTITKSHSDVMLQHPKFLHLATHMTLQFIREKKKDPSFIIFKQTRWGPIVMLLTLNRTSWERERERWNSCFMISLDVLWYSKNYKLRDDIAWEWK